MTPETASDTWEVRYVRSNRLPQGRSRIQEWRSDLTGRAYEVEEPHAFAASEELTPGARGYLRFVAGIPVVVRSPEDIPATGDMPPPAAPRAERPPPPPRARSRSRWLVWASFAVAAAVIVWAVVR